MFLKRLLLELFFLGVFAAQDSFAITCRDAVRGTCMHYTIGDGTKDKSYEVDNVYPDLTFCGIYRPIMGINCTFDVNQCPVPLSSFTKNGQNSELHKVQFRHETELC